VRVEETGLEKRLASFFLENQAQSPMELNPAI
jgi:hypothetical protein